MKTLHTDCCVIGAGSGGLSFAAGAAQMGADVILLEGNKMGGDCLNYGCVPSKSIIAAAKLASIHRTSSQFGIHYHTPNIDFEKVHDHIHDVIGQIEPHDSVERFESLGVKVIQERGYFINKHTVAAGNYRIKAKKIIISTGSSPLIPPIAGMSKVSYFTNETIFDLKELPKHLLIIGGGPIGIELCQAFKRLGSEVTLFQSSSILPNDEPELVGILRSRLLREGITLLEETRVQSVQSLDHKMIVNATRYGEKVKVKGSHLLIATGRRANVDNLGLDEADIQYSPKGITVDDRLRTSQKHIYAIGDVAGRYQFTHIAGYHASIAIQNALFKFPAKVSDRAIPWVTYTDPELAHVGLTEDQARAKHKKIKTFNWRFEDNDRAQAERATDGMVKVTTTTKGKILGASIVGIHAGELLQPWILAINSGLGMKEMANHIAPYPTLSEMNKRIAGSFFTKALFSEKTKKLVKFLMKFS